MAKQQSTDDDTPFLMNYTPMTDMATQPPPLVTSLDALLVSTAYQKYGRKILPIITPITTAKLSSFLAATSLRVVLSEETPREIRHIAADISKKEFHNASSERDESVLTVSKPVGDIKANSFEFFTTSGLICGSNADIGAKVLDLSLSGGQGQAASFHSTAAVQAIPSALSTAQSFCFDYTHKEKISVPPGKTVTVVATTYAVKYAIDYTIEFSILRSWMVPIRYKTRCQQLFCCSCSSFGHIFANELLRTLPNFREDTNFAYFTQKGTLTWVTESSKIETTEQ